MPDLEHCPDEDLLSLIRQGDEQAFLAFYQSRQRAIYRYALHMSGSEFVAEEITQDVFMTLLKQSDLFDARRGGINAYLYGIARKLILRHARRNRSAGLLFNGASEDCKLLISPADPLREVTTKESLGQLRAAILSLPIHFREVVVMCELEEMSYAEAALALSCAQGTVKSRLHRARALLVRRMCVNKEEGHAKLKVELKNSKCYV